MKDFIIERRRGEEDIRGGDDGGGEGEREGGRDERGDIERGVGDEDGLNALANAAFSMQFP